MVIMMLACQASVCCKCISFRAEVSVGCICVICFRPVTTNIEISLYWEFLSVPLV